MIDEKNIPHAQLFTADDDFYFIISNKGLKAIKRNKTITLNIAGEGKSRKCKLMSYSNFLNIQKEVVKNIEISAKKKVESEKKIESREEQLDLFETFDKKEDKDSDKIQK